MTDKADKAHTPANELLFLEHATHNEDFRAALVGKNWDKVMQELDSIGVKIEDKDKAKVRTALAAVDWSKLENLETLINHGVNIRIG
jgi:hypothetical protein